MPYTKSQARKTFDEEIDKMISVIRSTFRNIHSTNDIKEYVLSCSVMLCSAKLETYFEDFFDTWIHKVNALSLTNSHLPKNLRAVLLNQTSINKAFKRLIIENNESAFIDSIINDFSNKNFLLTDDTQVLPVLYSKRIYENKKYPSPENLKTMFKRIGINNIFSELNTSAKNDMLSILKSFNDFRTSIAHGGIPTGINNVDVIQKLTQIKSLVYHIDKSLFKHVNKSTTNATWTI